ncbi:MAG: hypothetical protein ING19_02680, partial [Azospirillum sp.]|nr:hypothetical protein [Azospirillum sp.]
MTQALAAFARRLAALHREFADELDRLGSEPGRESAAEKAAAATSPPAPRRRGKVDAAAFAAAWPDHDYEKLQAMFGLSPSGVFWWKQKLGLPSKPNARAARKPAPKLGWAPPGTNAGATGAPPPAKPASRSALSDAALAPFDETAPIAVDAVIKFLRQRDMT